MTRRSVKRGDDIPVDIVNVRAAVNDQLLPTAVVKWELFDRTNEIVEGGTGDAVLYDAAKAWFKLNVPRVVTEAFGLLYEYRLDIIFAYDGKQVTKSIELVAVDCVPA